MKKIHLKIKRNQVALVKKLASEIKKFGNYFTKEQITAMNVFYVQNYMLATRAKYIVLCMKDSKLVKLYFELMKNDSIRVNPNGNCFNEKVTMILFCLNKQDEYSKLDEKLQTIYSAFKK